MKYIKIATITSEKCDGTALELAEILESHGYILSVSANPDLALDYVDIIKEKDNDRENSL